MTPAQQVVQAHYRAARRQGLIPIQASAAVAAFFATQLQLDRGSAVLRDRERVAWQWRHHVLVRDLQRLSAGVA